MYRSNPFSYWFFLLQATLNPFFFSYIYDDLSYQQERIFISLFRKCMCCIHRKQDTTSFYNSTFFCKQVLFFMLSSKFIQFILGVTSQIYHHAENLQKLNLKSLNYYITKAIY